MKISKLFYISALVIIFFSSFLSISNAQATFYGKGEIITEREAEIEVFGEATKATVYEVRLEETDEVIEVVEQGRIEFDEVDFQVGDRVLIDSVLDQNGNTTFFITDFQRTTPIYVLAFLFIGLTILVARKKGLLSLVGLIISFFVIFQFLLRQILNGSDPLLIAILSAIIIIPINYYLAHGFTRKTSYAVVSTILTLILVGLLSAFFVSWARLSGFTSDEAGFIKEISNGVVNVKDLLMAGIIVGILGILDDITISQASIANQLKLAAPDIKFKELFFRTLEVGKDHIASLVNTLILVYTSAAMPLLLLIINSDSSFAELINREIVAEEIIRTLLTSIGLILAVPITTIVASYFVTKLGAGEEVGDDHTHGHHHH